MEFKVTNQARRGPTRLQFYRNPPSETIELNELEQCAIDRIRALKCVETVRQDFVFGSREYDDHLTSELAKLGPFGKSLTVTTTSAKNAKDEIRSDIISHFVLQVAYCRSEDLRRWFIQQEVELFRFRFMRERNGSTAGPDVIASFLDENQLHFTHLSDDERCRIQKQLGAGTAASGLDLHTTAFYKVFFAEVPELVRTRRVFISGGYAYVPDPDLVSVVVSHFRTSLSCNLARLGLTLSCRLASEENRVLPLLASLSSRYLGEDYSTKTPAMGLIKADQIDALAKQPGVFPPCMAQLHEALKTHHHLRHAGRMQYGLFLKGIGVPLEESLKFWRNSFAPKYDSDQFAKTYAYNIRHNYGKEGKRTDYTPYSCVKIISSTAPGTGDYHGCPFRHMDPELLRQRLSSSGRLTTESADAIVQRAKERLYHLACREYFRGMHKLDAGAMSGITIHHPNQYFEEGQRILRGEGATTGRSGTEQRVHVKKVQLKDSVIEPSIMDDDAMDVVCLEATSVIEESVIS